VIEHLEQARVPAGGGERAVEVVVGERGRGRVAGGLAQAPVRGAQLGDRLRVEGRRLPHG